MSHHPGLVPPVSARDHAQGPTTAPITLVEYGDYECPHCGHAYPIVKQMQKEFGDQLRFVFRNFPLNEIHPNAEHAAEAAEFAATVGKFWPMHDLLFEHQQHLKPADLRRYAEQLELDLRRYDAEMADHVYLQRVQEHLASGRASHVRGTPTFFVGGTLVDTSFGFEALQHAIAGK
jgi:protein-disulfide isomerase